MLGIDISAFVRMILLSLLLGACLGFLHEVLRFIFVFFFPRTDEGQGRTSLFVGIIVAVRDVIFFSVCGVAFAVFVYYTNNGNIRLFAVLGTLFGFFAFYFTVGRLARKFFGILIHIIHKLILFFTFPIRCLIEKYLPRIRSKVVHFKKE